MKKFLIISYYWPPAGGPGVQRWVKLSKYLSQLGYECHVVTVDEKHASYPSVDPSLQNDVSSAVKVTKTRSFEVLKIFSSLFKKEKVPYAGIPNKDRMSFIGKMALYIRSNFFIPDARMGWNKYALAAAEDIIRKENIEFLITTSPPHSTQLVGLSLKRKIPELKWVADLRDPWTDIYFYEKLSHTPASKAKDLALEIKVLLGADHLTTVSDDLKRIFLSKSPQIKPTKISVLPNGFDPEDFEGTTSTINEVFTIAHTGTINSNYNISGFIKSVKTLSAKQQLNVHFVGNVDPIIKGQLEEGLGELVRFTAYVPHTEITKHMRSADVLLLAIPDNRQNKGILTGKLFEYLASRKPILALGPPDGDAAAIIRDCDAGKMFAYDDQAGMEKYLSQLIADRNEGKDISVKSLAYQKYSRKELAKKYAQLLNSL